MDLNDLLLCLTPRFLSAALIDGPAGLQQLKEQIGVRLMGAPTLLSET